MRSFTLLLLLLPLLYVQGLSTPKSGSTASNKTDLSDPAVLVNLFIGTTNGGHSFPGATLPHGMAKPGLDTDSPGNQAGYDSNSTFNATGFSQLHDQGTGGSSSLSNFKLWPLASCHNFLTCPTQINDRRVLRKVLSGGFPDDAAEPGYFATNLSTNIRVELTSTRRTAIHRYTFPPTLHPTSSVFDPNSTDDRPRILLDIMNDGQHSAINPQVFINFTTGRLTGSANFQASFGIGRYDAFVCVDFAGDGYDLGSPQEFGAYTGRFPIQNTVNLAQVYGGSEQGALLTFAPHPSNASTPVPSVILARAGVSFISIDQACQNAEEEIPTFDFDGVRSTAKAAWNDILGRVKVGTTGEGVETEKVELLYSSLYRTHIVPADYTDENPKWNSTEPYYDSLYCNWDTFRTLYPLYSLHDPVNFARITRGMIDIQQHEGWLPECRGATVQQFVQGGSNADPILGEFFVKYSNHTTDLNVSSTLLFEALVQDAEVQPPNWDANGRQVNIWKLINYIPQDVFEPSGTNTKQVSRSLEYALGDFAVSQVAKILGNDSASVWANRSMNFINLWNENVTFPGNDSIKGFLQPRFLNGTFNFTDPRHCSIHDPQKGTCFLNAANRDGFYEDAPIVYSQFAPHDVASLIKLQGGTKAFIDRLDFIFDNGYFDSSNEPSEQIPYMYHYANQPSSSSIRSRQTIATDFNISVNGLPGNDDSGAMGSFVTFFLAGLYPVPATRQYLLSSPFFPSVSFTNPILNTTTTIVANNFNGNPTSGEGDGKNIFVKNVTINGVPSQSNCFLDFAVFEAGGTVELELVSNSEGITCGEDGLPPSVSTGGFD